MSEGRRRVWGDAELPSPGTSRAPRADVHAHALSLSQLSTREDVRLGPFQPRLLKPQGARGETLRRPLRPRAYARPARRLVLPRPTPILLEAIAPTLNLNSNKASTCPTQHLDSPTAAGERGQHPERLRGRGGGQSQRGAVGERAGDGGDEQFEGTAQEEEVGCRGCQESSQARGTCFPPCPSSSPAGPGGGAGRGGAAPADARS